MTLATNEIVTLANSLYPYHLSLDYTNKQVYWVTYNGDIFRIGYDGVKTAPVRGRLSNKLLLAVLADSVYYQNRNVCYINEMNMTSRMISRSIKVDNTDYRDLVVFHSSLQPMGKLKKHGSGKHFSSKAS